eukprot:CAMPEP_0117505622 /NCGR_PEP_ID=MMETSP0784-20121206/25478_1 /TAXON_ID=39447 /ORGANISM="" /LENGTH=447 /DNA_ID=CAMNT_0005301051 /DNA_START=78 /DNA_END=1421 /DNA_ORIENTATION=-
MIRESREPPPVGAPGLSIAAKAGCLSFATLPPPMPFQAKTAPPMPQGEVGIPVSTKEGSHMATSPVRDFDGSIEQHRQEMVREVVDAVCQRSDQETAFLAEELWARGKSVLKTWHQEQVERVAAMQGQLNYFTESYEQLQRENAALRRSLEAIVRHVQMLQWSAPPPMASWVPPTTSVVGCGGNVGGNGGPLGMVMPPQVGVPPSCRQGAPGLPPMPEEVAADLEESFSSEESPSSPAASGTTLSPTSCCPSRDGDEEDEETVVSEVDDDVFCEAIDEPEELLEDELPPSTPPRVQRGCPRSPATQPNVSPIEVDSVAARDSASPKAGLAEGATACGSGTKNKTPSTATPSSPGSPFGLTLRRVDGMPLGLEVRPDDANSCLHVERVQPGTVADAWNKQCAGEQRVIMSGDRVISVNGARAPAAMRNECCQKLLLRLEVVRDVAGDV